MTLQLRPYQHECFEHAKNRNTIVNLPTGKGKTLIAAKLINHFLELYPNKKIAFLVPTRPLVAQQAKYCEQHCRQASGAQLIVERLIGEDQSHWTQSEWDGCKCHVLLGVSALFQKIFVTDKFVTVSQFSLFIFDECHHAVGNSAMSSLMRDAVAPHVSAGFEPPRILGLTASFINGSLKNMHRKRQALESVMYSAIMSPVVDEKLTDESYIQILWAASPVLRQQMDSVTSHVSAATSHIVIKDVRKVVTRCTHVFGELGSTALLFYLDKVVLEHILEKANALEEKEDTMCKALAVKIRNAVPSVKAEVGALSNMLRNDPTLKTADSNKLLKLLDLLRKNFAEHGCSYRGIVFVEQVALVSALAKQINDNLRNIPCGAVAGTGSQSESDRQLQLEAFKRGEYRVLVATATLEEGIDVSECEFVVRFTRVRTTKAHIQGSGRARHPNAKIYYFDNNPDVERECAAALIETARNSALELGQGELNDAILAMNMTGSCHPYPVRASTSEGEVNVFNCKQIFNQYCSMVLGKSVSPKTALYKYIRNDSRKMLSFVRFPTPNGWQHKTAADCSSFWQGEDMQRVFQAERVKKKSASEMEEMAFVYFIVVELREKGHIDRNNRPDESIRFATRRNCELSEPQALPGLNLKDSVFT
jgi:endoribonuclease Dicer